MSKLTDEKREMKAKKFIMAEKEAFKKVIPRDTIRDVDVTECTEKDGAFEIGGSVSTLSPTEKRKTFGYTAVVNVDDEGNASLAKLKVSEL